jgi:putative glutamine amidotransferase
MAAIYDRAPSPATDSRSRIRAAGPALRSSAVRRVEPDAALFGRLSRVPRSRAADPGSVSTQPHLSIRPGGDPRRPAGRGHARPRRAAEPPRDLPLIAVTTSEVRDAVLQVVTADADPPRREMVLGMRYVEAVGRAGALAVVVPPLPGPAIPALLDRVDGICLSGGPDLHPSAYGAAPHPQLGPTEPHLDAFELALARAADERDMPILAICRGAQVLNVARGGTLHQHLPDVVGEAVSHRQRQVAGEVTHGVTVAPESRLAEIVGRRDVRVNSFHHQAVQLLGERLSLSAWAEDGTVEAFEAVDRSFVVGVQWHAECLVDHAEQAALFTALVAASAGREPAAIVAGGGRPAARAVADSA